MPNQLSQSSSPYLRQHAANPVDWRPWGEEAFAEARRRDVPVLVSIGYSTCHWCHVMAHESFEDQATAELMNGMLVCIKVDREEHPEVDAIYMDAVQALTGHGGWPLNALTDHAGRPFYACTYLPTAAWQRLLRHLGELWRTERAKVASAAAEITAHLTAAEPVGGALQPAVWQRLADQSEQTFDADHPGYAWNQERAPKFPPSQLLALQLASLRPDWTARAGLVLEAMQDSGLHERVGGGFHRYSVDRRWRLPHFEKMLYDNAQLIADFATAARQLARPDFLQSAVNAGDYLLRDLRVVEGGRFLGYAAAEDADDPGGEGSFYAWSPEQLRAALGDAAAAPIIMAWDIRPGRREIGHGGHSEPAVGHIPHPRGAQRPAGGAAGAALQAERASWEPLLPALRAARAVRPRPGRDDKVLTDQNALALEAFAVLARLSGEARFLEACRELSAVLIARHAPAGLLRLPQRPAYITDYGSLVAGLLAAFDLLGDPALIAAAARIADEAVARLRGDDGGFYTTPSGRSDLVRRGRESTDNAWPSGQNALALGMVRLWNLTGSGRWRALAEGIFSASATTASQAPSACATLLTAWLQAGRGHLVAVVAGDEGDPLTRDLLACCRRATLPGLAVVPLARCRAEPWSCLEGRRELTAAQALICLGTSCLAPATTVAECTARLAVAEAALARP
jgi:uncharacterized protein YyaL (SSP411 family)